jgi:hypothetical protein
VAVLGGEVQRSLAVFVSAKRRVSASSDELEGNARVTSVMERSPPTIILCEHISTVVNHGDHVMIFLVCCNLVQKRAAVWVWLVHSNGFLGSGLIVDPVDVFDVCHTRLHRVGVMCPLIVGQLKEPAAVGFAERSES